MLNAISSNTEQFKTWNFVWPLTILPLCFYHLWYLKAVRTYSLLPEDTEGGKAMVAERLVFLQNFISFHIIYDKKTEVDRPFLYLHGVLKTFQPNN